MICRTCGKPVNEGAAACLACGVPPLAGNRFCQSCGGETNPAATICVKCGVPLKTTNWTLPDLSGRSNKAIFAGLNLSGLIAFVILIFVCLPLCWLPFVIPSCKGD